NSKTGAGIAGAKLLVRANDTTLSAISGPGGAYLLAVPAAVRDQTSNVILQASAPKFNPAAVPVSLADGGQQVDIELDPVSLGAIPVETALHHLGDSFFSTALNTGLQMTSAESTYFSKSFTI